jgi:Putative adhesin
MMSNSTSNNKLKIFIIVCVVVFLTGLVATLTGLALHGWRDLDKLPGDWHIGDWHEYNGSGETETYTLNGNDAKFDAMDLNLALCEVDFKEGDDYKIEVTYDTYMTRPDISIENGTLVMTTSDEHLISGDDDGITMKVEITVPEGTTLTDAELTLDACQVDISELDAKNLDMSMDIGELILDGVSFETAKFNLNLCDATIKIYGEREDYDYDIVNGFGSLTLEGTDVENATADTNAPKHYEMDADLSDVTITYE